tara:strand:+ start:208 stop:837 length:630 start_codon:yes stop_codon:yes gene_type:complete
MKAEIKLILWDFGGVLTKSPIKKFLEYEKDSGVEPGTIVKINSHNSFNNAWAKLEKNLINKKQFTQLFLEEAKKIEISCKLDIEKLLNCLDLELNTEMVNYFLKIRKKFPCACLTNNISESIKPKINIHFKKFKKYFSFSFESSKLGLRKPEKEIYEYVLDTLNLRPENILFLDDLGINLKPAKAIGFKTYKVINNEDTKLYLNKLLGL